MKEYDHTVNDMIKEQALYKMLLKYAKIEELAAGDINIFRELSEQWKEGRNSNTRSE
jgi:hypothetical protein